MTRGASVTGGLSHRERYFFDLYGYVIRYGALDDQEVDELNEAVDRLNVAAPGPSVENQRFTGFLDQDRIFLDLIDHPAVLQPLIDLCGPTVRLDHAYGIHMTAGTSGLGLHGGGTPHDPAQFYTAVNSTIYNGLVAVQWALVDQGADVGGFRCVPGSHRANFPLPPDLPTDWVVDIGMSAGDVVIFTEALTHGTAPWTGPVDRRSLLYKYAPGYMAWSRQHATTMSDLARHEDLTPRQRRMLEPPSVGGRRPVLD